MSKYSGSRWIIGIALLSAGCSHQTIILKAPPAAIVSVASASGPAPLAIESVSSSLNQVPSPTDPAFIQAIAAAMRQTGLFAPVYEPSVAHQAPPDALRMRVQSRDFIDSHQGANMARGFVVGATFFLLAPVLPYHVDLRQMVEASIVQPAGSVGQYSTETAGQLHLQVFGNPALGGTELRNKVIASNLGALASRIREDGELQTFLQKRSAK